MKPVLQRASNGHTVHEDSVDQPRLLAALRGVRAGDFGVRLPLDWTGVPGSISEVFNQVVELNQRLNREFADLTQSHANVRAQLSDLTDMATDRDRVLNAVARGDLSQRVALDVDGRPLEGAFLRSGHVVNSMIQTLAIFADQVTTVAREVGTEGKLGGQAQVVGVDGSWKAVTDTVNSMAANLTRQVRNIAEVTTAVANGDLSKKITVVVSGEIGALAETINSMGDTLATMADQVTTVAREVGTQGKLGGQAQVTGVDGTWKSLTDSVNMMAANLTAQVRAIGEVSTAVTKGDLSRSIKVDAQGEIGQLKDTINEMISNLRVTTNKSTEQDWLKTSLARFTRTLQGQRELETVGKLILSELAALVNAQHGVLYVNKLDHDGQPLLQLVSTYAYRERKALAQEFRLGEGLVGQCAYEKSRILLSEVPGDYVRINSGLGAAPPLNIVVLPVLFEGDVKAVIELASFNRFSDMHLAFLDQLTESVGVVMNTISATARTEELLTQSQALSAERLQTNDQLEQKAKLLSEQNEEVERQKHEMDLASAALEQKAAQLALTSKYKSQFLANMSHELRTPLNSMLILSEQLSQNDESNLTPKQVEFAATILDAGNDLLALINDILDLSKIESGMMTADVGEVLFQNLEDDTRQTFEPVAQARGIAFDVDLDPGLPRSIQTDSARLQQVLKNLLSNAFKFTERGNVGIAVSVATDGWSHDCETLNQASTVISFAVSDTGIGIPTDKQSVIFEAFQQADMTTSRRFGGTGLGLSISREIANLLGGEICLTSVPRQGSCFTLFVPLRYRRSDNEPAGQPPRIPSEPEPQPRRRRVEVPVTDGPRARAPMSEVRAQPPAAELEPAPDLVSDDRDNIRADDKVLLIVDDDLRFTRTLFDAGHARGFKCLIALRGETALNLARRFMPAAVTLDIELPDLDGWKVLDALKHDPSTRHIPVHIISVDDRLQKALELGAVAGLTKPVTKKSLGQAFDLLESFISRPVKNLLVVEPDKTVLAMMLELIGDGDVQTTTVSTGAETLAALNRQKFDCMVLGLHLPDMTGFELIARIKQSARVPAPIVVYSSNALSSDEETQLRALAETVLVKDVRSPERLLDETALYLHRAEARLPVEKRKLLEKIHRSSPSIAGKKVLIVDDDMRNIFALTSALETHDMEILNAESGGEAIALLRAADDIDAVLMDIMMPEMDGFEVIRTLRADPQFADLPIIAVTAKAMKTDRDQCIEAGASDYISKPVDTGHLVSLLRVWLNRR